MMRSKLYPDAGGFVDAVAAAARDRTSWSAGERAALGRIAARRAAPLIRMRRRWFFAAGEFMFIVERRRGEGFTLTRVPSCRPALRARSRGPQDWVGDAVRDALTTGGAAPAGPGRTDQARSILRNSVPAVSLCGSRDDSDQDENPVPRWRGGAARRAVGQVRRDSGVEEAARASRPVRRPIRAATGPGRGGKPGHGTPVETTSRPARPSTEVQSQANQGSDGNRLRPPTPKGRFC
jgi:hypothetical protein